MFTLEWTHTAKPEQPTYGCRCKSVRNIRLQTFQAWNKHALLLTDESVNKVQLQRSCIKLVRPLSTVENTRYTRVFYSSQWFNCNIAATVLWVSCRVGLAWASPLENLACVMRAHNPQKVHSFIHSFIHLRTQHSNQQHKIKAELLLSSKANEHEANIYLHINKNTKYWSMQTTCGGSVWVCPCRLFSLVSMYFQIHPRNCPSPSAISNPSNVVGLEVDSKSLSQSIRFINLVSR